MAGNHRYYSKPDEIVGGNTRRYLQDGTDVGIGDRRTAGGVLSSAAQADHRVAAGDFNGGHLVVQSDDAGSGNNLGIISCIQEVDHGTRPVGVKEPNPRSEAADGIPVHATGTLDDVHNGFLAGSR